MPRLPGRSLGYLDLVIEYGHQRHVGQERLPLVTSHNHETTAALLDLEVARGRVAVGQPATVRDDAVPDRDYRAKVADISLLARADFSSGWPPPRDFDVELDVEDADARLKPGMTAAVRGAVRRLAKALVIPAAAVSLVDGRPTVYRVRGSRFEPVVVTIARRGREQVAVASGIEAGDRLAANKPPAATIEGGR